MSYDLALAIGILAEVFLGVLVYAILWASARADRQLWADRMLNNIEGDGP